MANDHSVVIVVPGASKADANAMLAAYFGDDPGSENLAQPASASGQAPPTHWFCHIYRNNASAAELAAMPTPLGVGTLPSGLDLTGYNITQAAAQTAAAALSRVSVKTGAVNPSSHVNDIMTELGLVWIH